MKRLAVVTVMLAASMLLSSCLGFTQATVNPGATATPFVPNTGPLPTSSQQGTPVSGTGEQGSPLGTVVGTFVPFVPETGEFSMDTTPEPLGTSVLSSNGQVLPYAATPFPGLGTSAAGTPEVTMNNQGSVPGTGNASDNFVRLTQLRSYTFSDNTGANLGSVSDYVISLPESRVTYLVVDTGSRRVLVPWSEATLGGSQAFGFSGSTDQFNTAPAFDQSSLDFGNPTWDQSFQQFWGNGGAAGTQTPGNATQGTSGTPTAILASQLLSVQVVTPGFNSAGTVQNGTAVPNTGNSMVLGQVQDALVNQNSGAISWLLVSLNNSFLNLNNRLIPVPFAAVSGNLDVNGLLLSINQNLLSNAPNLDAGNLPNIFGSGWDNGIQNFWQNNLPDLLQNPGQLLTQTP